MGLFDSVFKGAKASVPMPIQPQDTRPERPYALQERLRRECVRVSLSEDGWNFLLNTQMGWLTVKVRKNSRPEFERQDYTVTATDGLFVGWLSKNDFLRSGCKTRGEVKAMAYGPIWHGDTSGRVYIPITEEALKRRELDTWINVGSDYYTANGEVDEIGGDIFASTNGKGKPTFVIVTKSARICEVTSRMSCYETVAQLAGKKIRRIISERRQGDYGEYWRVGLYF